MRIGIDFDNTIVSYDHLFTTVARERGLIPDDFVDTKTDIRNHIRVLNDGETEWQRLQGRVVEHDKAACAEVAKQWGKDYWDGDRQYGYGGYTYDGRWRPIAEEIARHYGLKVGDQILDVGSGKAFLLYEFTQAVPGIEVAGIDISEYGIEHAKKEVRPFLQTGTCTLTSYFAESRIIVILAAINHSNEQRAYARQNHPDGQFGLVWINTSIDVCMARDPKGLYARAKKEIAEGKSPQVVGLDIEFEEPLDRDVVINTETESPEEATAKIVNILLEAGSLKPVTS